jgi:Carboxypeptidase regulatory-like domain
MRLRTKALYRSVVPLLLLLTSLVFAQSFRGSIRGHVVDPAGSMLPAAKVSAKNNATGQIRETTTGADGAYVLAELPAGEYTVTASTTGLSPVAQNVIVSVGLDTNADFPLTKFERQATELIVIAQAPVIDETRDTLGEVVERQLVSDLPLNGRDFGKLVALVPGATVEPAGVAAVQDGFGQFTINGNRDRSNNYTLDGTDNNDPFFNNSALNQTGIGGAPASLLPIDAIQEFNLQTQFPAEYGRNSGAVINIITKSGTNQFHGSGFEYVRNDMFDARNYFNRVVDADGVPQPKTGFHNNQFGASIGGPIIKDKTFFFGAYEGQRERVGSDFSLLVPTGPQLSEAQAIMAGMGTPASPALTSILTRFFPASNSGVAPGVVHDTNDVDSMIAKIDQQFSGTETFSARYAFDTSQQVFPLGGLGGFGSGSRLAEFAQTSPARVQVFSASWLSTLSVHELNEVRFGYSRYTTSFTSLDSNFNPATLGIDFGTGQLGLPEIDFGGVFDNLGATGYSIPRGRTSQSFQILDNFTIESGRNTFKFGGEFRRAEVSSYNNNLERGVFSFSPADPTTLGPCSGAIPAAGCSDAGVLTLISYYQGNTFPSIDAGNTQRTTFNNGLAFFLQDDFRAAPHLTLNLGLRWEYFGPISEANNILANLGPDGLLHMVGTGGVNGAYKRDLTNFGPRIGFAWNPISKTILRGGYGIYYDYIPQDLMIANFTNDAGLVTPPLGPKPVISLANNYNQAAFANPAPGNPVFTVPPGPYPIAGSDIFFTPRNMPAPYSQSWNLNLQQEMLKNIALQVGYVGSKGTKLVRLLDANQPNAAGVRPDANYGFMDEFAPISSSSYNALQATLRVQGSHKLSGFAGYTFSKSLDDASDGIDYNFSTVALPQNSYDLAAERGPSNFDTRHRFTAAFVYQIPTFHGPQRLMEGWQFNTIFTAQSGRPVPIVSADDTSGLTFDQFPSPSNFHQRPNIVPGVNPINPNWASGPDTIGYLNGNAFVDPPLGTFGDLGRNAIFGPDYWDLDWALEKNTPLAEHVRLQLRGELFNILNHPNFALPNWFVSPGVPGLITQTPDQAQTNPGLGGGGPRVIQLAAKIIF